MATTKLLKKLALDDVLASLSINEQNFKKGFASAYADIQQFPPHADSYFHQFKKMKKGDLKVQPLVHGQILGAALGMMHTALSEKMDSFAKYCLMAKHLLKLSSFFEVPSIRSEFYNAAEEGEVRFEILKHYDGELGHLQLEIDAFKEEFHYPHEKEDFERAFKEAYTRAFKSPGVILSLKDEIIGKKYFSSASMDRYAQEGEVLGTVMGVLHGIHHSVPKIEGIFITVYLILKETGLLKKLSGKRIVKHLIQEGKLEGKLLKRMRTELKKLDVDIETNIDDQLRKWPERQYYLAFQEAYIHVKDIKVHFVHNYKQYTYATAKDLNTPLVRGSRDGAALAAIDILCRYWQKFDEQEPEDWFIEALTILRQNGKLKDNALVADIQSLINDAYLRPLSKSEKPAIKKRLLALLAEHS